MSDQQFCLRWNNHQNTLVTVFETLLVNERLTDVTLTAEGQMIGAHKVVLSACSSYFEKIFSKCGEKHPIIFLKDVRFTELKALLDYMYRGEVNVSQDQLSSLIQTAESLKIKGLADNEQKENKLKGNYNLLEKQILDKSREGTVEELSFSSHVDAEPERSLSPVSKRRKRRIRSDERNSIDDANTFEINTSLNADPGSPNNAKKNSLIIPNIPATVTPIELAQNLDMSVKINQSDKIICSDVQEVCDNESQKYELEVKEEISDVIQDFTFLEENNVYENEIHSDNSNAGPSRHQESQARLGEWEQGSLDDPAPFMYPTVYIIEGNENYWEDEHKTRPFICPRCCRTYKKARYLRRHVMEECGVERKYQCSICGSKFAHSHHLRRHVKNVHRNMDEKVSQIKPEI